jgi:hypothetical protein
VRLQQRALQGHDRARIVVHAAMYIHKQAFLSHYLQRTDTQHGNQPEPEDLQKSPMGSKGLTSLRVAGTHRDYVA